MPQKKYDKERYNKREFPIKKKDEREKKMVSLLAAAAGTAVKCAAIVWSRQQC